MIQLVPATAHHVENLLSRVRPADHAEFAASYSGTVETGIKLGLLLSQKAHAGIVRGSVIAIAGLYVPYPTLEVGVPWMVGSVTLEDRRIQKDFMRTSRQLLAQYASGVRRLENWVDSRNTAAVRWLTKLGFKIHPPEPHGPKNMMFHRFEMEGTHV